MASLFRVEVRLGAQQGLLLQCAVCASRPGVRAHLHTSAPSKQMRCHSQRAYPFASTSTRWSHIHQHHATMCAQRISRRCMQTEAAQEASGSKGGVFARFFRSLKWAPIPVTLGVMVMAVEDYRHAHKREVKAVQGKSPEELVLDPWMVTAIRKFPTRFFSSLFGDVMSLRCPLWLRRPLYGLYAKVFGCNLEEMAEEDLVMFESMQDFFTRRLKDNARPVDQSAPLVSPADARVLYYGPVVHGRTDQIKGISYSIRGLLGPDLPVTEKDYAPQGDTVLHHIILYLAPGDYHRFHSCADWSVDSRRYFPGDLLSVSPAAARLIKGLFNYNERASLTGQWEHGFFGYVAVGAYNVGSIQLHLDPAMVTNQRGVGYLEGEYRELPLGDGVKLSKGEEVGLFRLGSTLVLVFEAPRNFQFSVNPGDRVLVGQKLGDLVAEEGPAAGA